MTNDDIFGDEEFLGSSSNVEKHTKEPEVVVKSTEDVNVQTQSEPSRVESDEDLVYTNEIPSLLPIEYPKEFLEIYNRIVKQYVRLPRLKYSEVYEELAELTVKSSETPTLQSISKELERSQASKERVSELEMQVSECLLFKERAVSVLRESWYKFSEEKSSEKRKGDSQYRLASFELDLAKTESISKACLGVMKNLDSLQNVLSRKITNIQLQIKLMDIGRPSLPDFSFSKKFDGDLKIGETEITEPAQDINPNESISAKELDF